MTDHKVDIHKLEKQITDVSDALANLGSKEDFLNLVKIIRRPGWTTPAEFQLVRAVLESMEAQTRQLQELKGNLMRASERVGVPERGMKESVR